MMRKQSSQMQMIILDIEAMIPERHLLRQIKNCVKRMPAFCGLLHQRTYKISLRYGKLKPCQRTDS